MKILIYEGNSTYNALNFFIQEIKLAFEELGHTVFIFNLLNNLLPDKQLSLITNFKPDFTFSFNCQLMYFNNIPAFDFLKIPHFAFLVDHPIHHLDSLININSSFLNISCVDKNHLKYCTYAIPNKKIDFLPMPPQ